MPKETKEQRWARRGTKPGKSKYAEKASKRPPPPKAPPETNRPAFQKVTRNTKQPPPPGANSHSYTEGETLLQTQAFLGAGKIRRPDGKPFGQNLPSNKDALYCFLTMRAKGKGLVVAAHLGTEQALSGKEPWQTHDVAPLPVSGRPHWEGIINHWLELAEQGHGSGVDVKKGFQSSFAAAARGPKTGLPPIPDFDEGEVVHTTSAHIGAAKLERAKDIPLGKTPSDTENLYCFLSLTHREGNIVLERHTAAPSIFNGHDSWKTQHVNSYPVDSVHIIKAKMETWDYFAGKTFPDKRDVVGWPPETPTTTPPETPAGPEV